MRLPVILMLVLMATACGKTGDLYLPDEEPAATDGEQQGDVEPAATDSDQQG